MLCKICCCCSSRRCATAKRKLGDDLLTAVVLVPVGPFDFDKRSLLRKYLSAPAHKLRRRQYYRKIQTLTARKRKTPWYDHNSWVKGLIDDKKRMKYTHTHKWEWLQKSLADPVDDARAVCLEVLFVASE